MDWFNILYCVKQDYFFTVQERTTNWQLILVHRYISILFVKYQSLNKHYILIM